MPDPIAMERRNIYHRLIREHFPGLLRKIADQSPHAIVFFDSSARPFAWLTSKLWSPLGLGKKPELFLLSPPALRVNHTRPTIKESEAWRGKFSKWLKSKNLTGKRVVLFDDCIGSGRSLDDIAFRLKGSGVLVTTAAFARPRHNDLGIPAFVPPYWNGTTIMERRLGEIFASRGSDAHKAAHSHLRQVMQELAQEIIAREEKAK